MVKPTRGLNFVSMGKNDLANDFDKAFILNGIDKGFDII